MSARATLALLVLSATTLIGCDKEDLLGLDNPPAVDRSGTWTFDSRRSDPCPGDSSTESFSVVLTQSGRTLTGTKCSGDDQSTLESWQVTLSDNNVDFFGTVSGCESVNDDCRAPFDPQDCFTINASGSFVDGNTFSGNYSRAAPGACGNYGSFTGTVR